jgi:UDP-glucose 4-epimerase
MKFVDRIDESYRGLRAMVAGGLGFIGSNLARRLADAGAEVLVVDALLPHHGGNRVNLAGYEDRVRVSLTDLRDENALRGLVPGQQVVFNVAGQVSHLDSMTHPVADVELNAVASAVLLELCRELAPDATIVYASTRQIYGRPEYLPVDERHPLRPVDINGINKMAAEAYHALYHKVYGMRTVSLRLTNTYGPRMRIKDARQTFLGVWLRCAIENRRFEVWDGRQRRDLVFIDDAIDAFLAAGILADAAGGTYNIGGGPPVTLDDLARLLIEIAGTGQFVRCEFPPDRKRIDIGDYFADDRPFRKLAGWNPEIDLRQGLTRSLDYYRTNLASYI